MIPLTAKEHISAKYKMDITRFFDRSDRLPQEARGVPPAASS
jgi:hypothetical protein